LGRGEKQTFVELMKKSHLTLEQRYEIQAFLKMKIRPAEIARQMGRDRSVISREIRRNSDVNGKYRASYAQENVRIRKERYSRPRKMTAEMEAHISDKMRSEQWSPEQIRGHAEREGVPMVSHERIYQFIRDDRANGGDLYKHTRHRLKKRKRPVGGKKFVLNNKISIDDRPAVVGERSRIGDWEVDTIVGPANRGAILTMVERATGFLFMRKLEDGKNAEGLGREMVEVLFPYMADVHTITSDNGTEFARHKEIAERLECGFYFAHPYSSWERGLNEYTNKLIRQYIPKKHPIQGITQQEINQIQYKINRRPRKKLGYLTPVQLFYRTLPKDVAFIT